MIPLVFVSGVDDADSDGDVEYAVRFTPTSFDSQYNGVGGVEISLTNRDDDPPPAAPAIRTQPRSLTITAGDSARFSVVASGVPAPTFQWSFDGQPIQGQTSDILNLQNVQVEQAGRYSVQASNSAGELASSAAALTVDLPVAPSAGLSLVYDSVPVSASVGQELKYGLVIGNQGPDAATSTTVTVDVPESFTSVSATPNQGTCSETGGTVTCLLGNLNAGRSANITIVTIPGSKGQVAQSASVFSAEADPDGSNNLVTATAVPVEQPSTEEPPQSQPGAPAPTPTPDSSTPPPTSQGCGAAIGEGPFPADIGMLLILLPAVGFLIRRRNRKPAARDDDPEMIAQD
jgi:uncharacterized repeat protein (TIGR01451 family)